MKVLVLISLVTLIGCGKSGTLATNDVAKPIVPSIPSSQSVLVGVWKNTMNANDIVVFTTSVGNNISPCGTAWSAWSESAWTNNNTQTNLTLTQVTTTFNSGTAPAGCWPAGVNPPWQQTKAVSVMLVDQNTIQMNPAYNGGWTYARQ